MERRAKNFFCDELKQRKGKYYFKERRLNAGRGTPVLFQFDGAIIASALLDHSDERREPDDDGFRGALYFDMGSLIIFNPPLTAKDIHGVWPEFPRFNQTMWRLRRSRYSLFQSRFEGRKPRHTKRKWARV